MVRDEECKDSLWVYVTGKQNHLKKIKEKNLPVEWQLQKGTLCSPCAVAQDENRLTLFPRLWKFKPPGGMWLSPHGLGGSAELCTFQPAWKQCKDIN